MSIFTSDSEFSEQLSVFAEKVAEFERVFALVTNTSAETEALASEKSALLGRASWIRTAIQRAREAINWAQQNLGQYMDVVQDDRLGFAPLAIAAAVAAISGAVAFMASWISDAYSWAQKAEIAREMQEAGASPAEIGRAISEPQNGLSFGHLLPLLIIGGIVLWQRAQ